MLKHLTRRQLMTAGLGMVAFGSLPRGVSPVLAATAYDKVRMSTGTGSVSQSMAWLGAEAGIFKDHGVDVSFPALEVGAFRTAAGLMNGDWEFCTTGFLPVAENFLNGGDVVGLLRTTVGHSNQFIAAKRELTTLGQLAGKRIGVTSDAYSGGVGVRARLTVEKAGAAASYVGLGTFQNIYAALAKGEIDAGVVPLHLRFSGQNEHGWNIFDLSAFETEVPSVLATTRKLIASNRDLVMRVVKGYVKTAHAFKTEPNVFVPLLERFLKLSDRKIAEDMHRFYVPLFPQVPRVELADAMPSLRDTFSKKYPAVQRLQESDVVDSSFIDELEKSGFIQRLYAGKSAP